MEPFKVALRMSAAAKLLYVPVILGCLLFAAEATNLLISGFDRLSAELLGELALGLAFFGGGAVLIAILMVRSAGYLDVSGKGLLIDSYISGGLLPWDNLAAVGIARGLGVRYLGIAVADVDAYIASRGQVGLLRARDRAVTQGFVKFMLAVAPLKAVNIILALFGYSEFPEKPTEGDTLKWNKQNFGYHILIQAFWVPRLEETVARILAAKPLVVTGRG